MFSSAQPAVFLSCCSVVRWKLRLENVTRMAHSVARHSPAGCLLPRSLRLASDIPLIPPAFCPDVLKAKVKQKGAND